MKKVSIIVPIYNSEKHLKGMLDSLVNQTYPKEQLEVVLVNDGSTDSSKKICEEYCGKFNNFKLISQKNGGISSARNAGLSIATGEYVTFLDSDDTCNPKYVEIMASGMEQSNVDLFCCGIIENRENVGQTNYGYDQSKIFPITDEESYVDFFNDYWLPVVWNKLYKKSLIKENFAEGISYDEDTVFNLNYLKNVKNIACSKHKLYTYHIRQNEKSLTTLGKNDIFEKSKVTNKYRIDLSREIFQSNKAVYVACKKIIKAIFQEVQNNHNQQMSKEEILAIASKRMQDKDVIRSFSYFTEIAREDAVIEDILANQDVEKLYDCAINGFDNYLTQNEEETLEV